MSIIKRLINKHIKYYRKLFNLELSTNKIRRTSLMSCIYSTACSIFDMSNYLVILKILDQAKDRFICLFTISG